MEQQQTTTTESSTFRCQLSVDYIRKIEGILKIIEIVLSIIAFGCSVGSHNPDLGWTSFVAITGFISAIVWLIWHMLVQNSWRWNVIIELINYALWTLFFLIAGIVAAVYSGNYYTNYKTAGAASAFAFFCMVAWAVDTALQARHVSISFTSSQTTTTTTTATASNTATRFDDKAQY
jgi:hypothetical protein